MKFALFILIALASLRPAFAQTNSDEQTWSPIRDCGHGTLVTEQAEIDLGRGEPVLIYRVIVREPAALSYFQKSGVAAEGAPFGAKLSTDSTGTQILILGEKTTSPIFVEFDEMTRKSNRPFSATVRSEGDGLKVLFHRYDKVNEQTQAIELANWFFGECRDLSVMRRFL